MNYMCVLYEEEHGERDSARIPATIEAGVLRRDDVSPLRLGPIQEVATVRVRHGNLEVSALGRSGWNPTTPGYCLIEAMDLNDAIRLAARLPEAHRGRVEVWPLPPLHGPLRGDGGSSPADPPPPERRSAPASEP